MKYEGALIILSYQFKTSSIHTLKTPNSVSEASLGVAIVHVKNYHIRT